MQLTGIWSDDNKLRAVFSWLTRIGAAPKFGTLPIAYYQQDRCKAIETLEAAIKTHGLPEYSEIKTRNGYFLAKAGSGAPWVKVAMMSLGKIEVCPKQQCWSNAECGQ